MDNLDNDQISTCIICSPIHIFMYYHFHCNDHPLSAKLYIWAKGHYDPVILVILVPSFFWTFIIVNILWCFPGSTRGHLKMKNDISIAIIIILSLSIFIFGQRAGKQTFVYWLYWLLGHGRTNIQPSSYNKSLTFSFWNFMIIWSKQQDQWTWQLMSKSKWTCANMVWKFPRIERL